MEYNSDTGFESEDTTEDDVVEILEGRGTKRRLSVDEIESNKKVKAKIKKHQKEKELKELHKPPTAEELNRLKETQNLFHSNLFRLQIEEMLKEVKMKEKKKMEFETWFSKFSDWILKMQDNNEKYEIVDQEWLKKLNMKIPVPQMPYLVKGHYQFKKPSAVTIIGSYATNMIIWPKAVVDVLIEMPRTFFQKEDFLNCRYHRKRALYMCELLHHIQLLPNLIESASFVCDEADNLKPYIEITPSGNFNKNFTVFLYFGIEAQTFKLSRFSPSKNNVREAWYFKKNTEELGK